MPFSRREMISEILAMFFSGCLNAPDLFYTVYLFFWFVYLPRYHLSSVPYFYLYSSRCPDQDGLLWRWFCNWIDVSIWAGVRVAYYHTAINVHKSRLEGKIN